MARVFTNERVFLTPVVGPLERLVYRSCASTRALAGLEGLRRLAARLLRPVLAGAVPDPAHADAAPVQPGRLSLGHLGPQLQHRLVVRHQHELAVLRRRDDALVLQPDGRPGGAELRLRRASASCVADRADPRDRRAPHRRDRPRQLLAGPHARAAVRAAADLDRRRARARLPGRRAVARREWGPVASQEIIKELGTNGGGFFNVELRDAVREPERAHELPRDAGDPRRSRRR